jgi:hypothetical protein
MRGRWRGRGRGCRGVSGSEVVDHVVESGLVLDGGCMV